MTTLSNIISFLEGRPEIAALDWQIFDLSAAQGLIEEMKAQYAAGSGVYCTTPPPARNCIFFIDGAAVCCVSEGDHFKTFLLEEMKLSALRSEVGAMAGVIREVASSKLLAEADLKGQGFGRFLEKDYLSRSIPPQGSVREYIFSLFDKLDEPEAVLSALCSEFISFPIASVEKLSLPRPVRRRMQKSGVSISVSEVSVGVVHPSNLSGEDGEGAARALHFCRGHWRRNEASPRRRMVNGAWRIWIDGHWKGDASKGVVLHNYVASLDDVAAKREALVLS